MHVRRWRPDDRCVSFHHYLQGSSGAPGRDGLKGEKVGKLEIKFSPQRKIRGYDVLSQVQHARQLVKIHYTLLGLHATLSHSATLCVLVFDVSKCYVIYAQISSFAIWLVPNTESSEVHSWHAYLMGFVTCQNKWSCTPVSPPTGVIVLDCRAEKWT